MFCFPSFVARLLDEISTTDVLKDRANIRLSASRPCSQGGGLGGGGLCDSSQISKRKFPECTLTSAAFTPVFPVDADPGLNPAALSRSNVAANIQQGHERREAPDGFFPTRVLDLGQAWNSTPTPTLLLWATHKNPIKRLQDHQTLASFTNVPNLQRII